VALPIDLDKLKALAAGLKSKYTAKQLEHACRPDPSVSQKEEMAKYVHDPVRFAKEVLDFHPTPDQEQILSSFPGRVKVNSGHSLGKTASAAVLAVWWYYTRSPGVVVITAPTKDHVETVLWAEVRILLNKARIPYIGKLSPKAADLYDHDDHWIKGRTAGTAEASQGKHRSSMLFIFDESEGIDSNYWITTNTMYQPDSDHGWFAIGNPVTTASQSYLEDLAEGPDGKPKWKLFSISALDHPNIQAQLAGQKPIIPNAVTLAMVQGWVKEWTDPVSEEDRLPTDIEWPPQSGKFHRPGPMFKARVQGIRPTEGVDTVWSELAWLRAITPKYTHEHCWWQKWGITIGIDTATFGDDDSVLHVRSGRKSLHHESHNGWGPEKTAQRAKDLAEFWAAKYNSWAAIPTRPRLQSSQVRVIIELDGPGVGVFSHCNGFGDWVGVNAANSSFILDSTATEVYENMRAEWWFEAKKKAMNSEMDLSELPQDVLKKLRLELLTPSYKISGSKAYQVEKKEDIKKRLGRSPDNADAMLVCYHEISHDLPSVVGGHDDDFAESPYPYLNGKTHARR